LAGAQAATLKTIAVAITADKANLNFCIANPYFGNFLITTLPKLNVEAIMAIEVTVNELASAIEHGGFVLDVRENDEWAQGHVPNAHHIPMNDVADRLDQLDDGARIFVICRSGKRSMTVADFLAEQGFDVVSVSGGTLDWIDSGRELSFSESL